MLTMALTGTEKVTAFRTRRRLELIALAGGECIKCGYSKCSAALVFHHRDPSQKKFVLSRAGIQRSRSEVMEEFAKCDLLCANCHAEAHHGAEGQGLEP